MPVNNKLKTKKFTRRSVIRFFLIIIPAGLLAFFLFIFLVYSGLFGKLPDYDELRGIKNYTASEVYSADNYILGRYYLENRTNTRLEDIPEFLVNALIATEDARFFSHKGIDTRSTLRVIVKSLLLFNKSAGGGSTLTQQLAKNLYPRKRLGIFTLPVAKVREIIVANRLEKIYGKQEILDLYLNTVSFGDNTFGIETAALVYFSKKTSELLPEESAVLVGMLKGTADYNPRLNMESSLNRRNIVIGQMVKYAYITQQQSDSLQKLPLKINYRNLQHDEGPAPYFREFLRQELKRWADENPKPDGTKYNIYTDGLKIYTTIDYKLQTYAERAVSEHMSRLQKEFDNHWKGRGPWKKDAMLAWNAIKQSDRYKQLAAKKLSREKIIEQLKIPVRTKIFTWQGEKELEISPLDSVLHYYAMLQAGLLSIESKSGYVKAWVGGINYKYFKFDHVTSRRQAGSTFKPFVYAAAIEKGISPCQFYPNDSVVYKDYSNWVPKNSDGNYGGYYSLVGALTHSINTVSVHVLMDTGIDEVVDLARKLGIEGDLPAVPSLALGTGTISLLELAKGYSVFLNQGYQVQPVFIRRIEDQNENILFTAGPEISSGPLISENTAGEINAMLCRVVDSGTAASLRSIYGFSCDLAGKTGTTQDQTDGWFVGLTPDLITIVWVGGDDPKVRFRSITYGQGAYMALPVFANYLKLLYNDPLYSSLQYSKFNISEQIRSAIQCDDYREEEFDSIIDFLQQKEESIGDFIRRIFRGKKDKKNDQDNEN